MLPKQDKECKKHGLTPHVLERGTNRFRCQKCRVVYTREKRKRTKAALIEHLGGKCQKCGYNKCPEALDFHHRDPATKDFEFGNKYQWSLAKLMVEVEKCDLLCANCHREEHARLDNLASS